MDWLPLLLPDRVKVILSVAEDTPMHKALIAKLNDSSAFIQVNMNFRILFKDDYTLKFVLGIKMDVSCVI